MSGTTNGKNGNSLNGNGFNGQPINVIFTEALRAPPAPQDNNFLSQRSGNQQTFATQPQVPFNVAANPTQVSPSQTTFTNPPPASGINQNYYNTFNQPTVNQQARSQPQTTNYNPADWFRRYGRSVTEVEEKPQPVLRTEVLRQEIRSFNESLVRVKRQPLESLLLDESKLPENAGLRSKRQSFDQEALCQVRTQFIQPQAALNNKG